MPLFFIVAGYFFKKKPIIDLLKKDFGRLLVPYYFIIILIILLSIVYDYLGIEKWYKGEWKAKTPIAIEYVNYANEAKKKININFFKIESHTNNKYNDLADELAKEALK